MYTTKRKTEQICLKDALQSLTSTSNALNKTMSFQLASDTLDANNTDKTTSPRTRTGRETCNKFVY